MESVEKNTGELLGLPIVKGMQIKSQTVRIPKGFFIYGKLRPYLNKYCIEHVLHCIFSYKPIFVQKDKHFDSKNGNYNNLLS